MDNFVQSEASLFSTHVKKFRKKVLSDVPVVISISVVEPCRTCGARSDASTPIAERPARGIFTKQLSHISFSSLC